jgi:hypothetical protein
VHLVKGGCQSRPQRYEHHNKTDERLKISLTPLNNPWVQILGNYRIAMRD